MVIGMEIQRILDIMYSIIFSKSMLHLIEQWTSRFHGHSNPDCKDLTLDYNQLGFCVYPFICAYNFLNILLSIEIQF